MVLKVDDNVEESVVKTHHVLKVHPSGRNCRMYVLKSENSKKQKIKKNHKKIKKTFLVPQGVTRTVPSGPPKGTKLGPKKIKKWKNGKKS